MPASENLYAANDNPDSDAESFGDELSPTDGYFRSEIPSNTMVPDPSRPSDDKTVEDKVLISGPATRTNAERASQSTNSPTLAQLLPAHNYASPASGANMSSSATSNTPSLPRSFHRTEPLRSEDNLIDAVAPPPAYSASPPLPTSPQALQDNQSYNTFQHHLEQYREAIIPNWWRERMGAPNGELDERAPLAGWKRNSRSRIIIRKLLFVALVITVLIGSLSTMLSWKSESPSNPPGKNPSKDTPPGKRPVGSGSPYCSSATFQRKEVTYEVPLDGDLAVIQTIHVNHGDAKDGNWMISTAGEIRLKRLPKDSKYGHGKGHLTVNVHVSDPSLQVIQTLENNSRTLKISTPRYARLDTPGPHCISLEIIAWLPEDAKLRNMLIKAITLTLRVLDDVKIDVSDLSTFETVSGDVYFPQISGSGVSLISSSPSFDSPQAPNALKATYSPEAPDVPNIPESPISQQALQFSSRRIDVSTVSGDINGQYPLLDHLGLTSQSGDIKISVSPHDALPSAPLPADLLIHTASGDIDVRLPIGGSQDPQYVPPPRDYITKVHSASGDITGSFYLGTSGHFESTSGDITMKILPIVQSGPSNDPDKDENIHFGTETVSGSMGIEILDPIFISPVVYEQPVQRNTLDHFHPIGDDDSYGPNLLLPPTGKLFSIKNTSDSKLEKLRSLQSSHTSKSGGISVRYPDVWEGKVSGKTISGKITVSGEGLKVVKNKKGWGSKEVLAVKGSDGDDDDAGSSAVMQSISGNQRFVVGAATN